MNKKSIAAGLVLAFATSVSAVHAAPAVVNEMCHSQTKDGKTYIMISTEVTPNPAVQTPESMAGYILDANGDPVAYVLDAPCYQVPNSQNYTCGRSFEMEGQFYPATANYTLFDANLDELITRGLVCTH
jgi:hypothetical protein